MEVDKHIHFEDVFWQLTHNPARVECFRQAITAIAKPNATEDLYALTASLIAAYESNPAIPLPVHAK